MTCYRVGYRAPTRRRAPCMGRDEVDVKSEDGREELRKLFAYPSSTDNNAHHARGMLDYIDTLEAERNEYRRVLAELPRRDLAVADAVREEARAVVALEHCDNEHEACRCTERVRTLNLPAIIAGVKT